MTGVGTSTAFFPSVTAVQAYLLFGETLDPLALIGMSLITLGVPTARQSKIAPS